MKRLFSEQQQTPKQRKLKMNHLMKFFKDEDGMELTEYAVVGGLIIAVTIAIFATWGGVLNGIFNTIVGGLQGN